MKLTPFIIIATIGTLLIQSGCQIYNNTTMKDETNIRKTLHKRHQVELTAEYPRHLKAGGPLPLKVIFANKSSKDIFLNVHGFYTVWPQLWDNKGHRICTWECKADSSGSHINDIAPWINGSWRSSVMKPGTCYEWQGDLSKIYEVVSGKYILSVILTYNITISGEDFKMEIKNIKLNVE
jgi:hypothetical protein